MRKLFVIAYDGELNPATRLRILQYIPGLKEAGWEVETAFVVQGKLADPVELIREIREGIAAADVVVVQRVLAGWLNRLLERSGRPVVFDMDDALHYIRQSQMAAADTPNGAKDHLTIAFRKLTRGGKYFSSRKRHLDRMMKLARVVIVGNRWLKDELGGLAEEMRVLPTAVPADQTPMKEHGDHAPVRIGWIGVKSNLFHLGLLEDVFARLAAEFGDRVLLTVVSSEEYISPNIRTEFIRWSLEEESRIVSTFDIGIMPLQDDLFSRGKCSFKAILCMSHGIPVVISPVGMNIDLVENGFDGFLAGDAEAWFDGLFRLIGDSGLRAAMGRRAYEKIGKSYSSRYVLGNLLEILSRLA
ncbi:MAG: glycosyltransferase [Bacteroidota bacterium]